MTSEWAGVITAIISGFCVAVPTIVTTITSNKAHDKVIDERMKYMTEQIKDLSVKVEKHNEFNEKLVILDQKVTAEHHRLDVLYEQIKKEAKS